MCVIYPNTMIYLPVQFYILCPVLSGNRLSFSTKCPILPRITLKQRNSDVFFGI